jgi:N-methylhydantoinase A/oxoprolinase/acetone carboxylase beta subunit
MSVSFGIDTGGTFTDFVRLTRRGLDVSKRRSTPDDPSRAILEGLTDLPAAGPAVEIFHGSTVATNAVLERKGAPVALVATEGFEDILRIGRQTRSELYNIFIPLPRPLVDPSLTFGLRERLGAAGGVLVAVNDEDVDRLADRLRQSGAEIVAVCLLHSYANPAHERRVAERLRARGLLVCSSHEVLPEYREFERWSTTVVNAYVTPMVDRYLGRLESALVGPASSRHHARRLSIMQSNGGSISAGAARAQAVRTILSGPAAGVVGARAVARAAGFRRVIAFDMGGTSTDVSLIDGAIRMTTESRVGDFPVRVPMIDILTVGAGGGSIAWIDSGGALRVGPQSAGASPGPACYGTGDQLTVTDANVILGRLDPEFFLGGRMKLDVERPRSIARDVARALDLDVPRLAEGIVRVANANMERAIRVISIERGHDPRAFALLPFGGAGPMHACEMAERLEISTVVVPRLAGVLSAFGMLASDVSKDYSATVLRPTDDISLADLAGRFRPLVRLAGHELRAEGFRRERQRIGRFVDVRYAGQSYELTVPFSAEYRREFDRQHEQRYGYANRLRPTEVVAIRVIATGVRTKPELSFRRPRRKFTPKPHDKRQGRFGQRATAVTFYRWDALEPGAGADGAAVITSPEATVVIPPGWRFRIDGFQNVIATMRRVPRAALISARGAPPPLASLRRSQTRYPRDSRRRLPSA